MFLHIWQCALLSNDKYNEAEKQDHKLMRKIKEKKDDEFYLSYTVDLWHDSNIEVFDPVLPTSTSLIFPDLRDPLIPRI